MGIKWSGSCLIQPTGGFSADDGAKEPQAELQHWASREKSITHAHTHTHSTATDPGVLASSAKRKSAFFFFF